MNPKGRPAPISWRYVGALQGRGGQNQGWHLTSGSEARPGFGESGLAYGESPQLLQRLLARAHPGSPAPGDHAHSLQCKMEARARARAARPSRPPGDPQGTGLGGAASGFSQNPRYLAHDLPSFERFRSGDPRRLAAAANPCGGPPEPGGLRRRPGPGLLPPVPGALVREGPAPATPFDPASFPRPIPRLRLEDQPMRSHVFPGGPASQSRLGQWELERSSPRRCRGRVARGSTKWSREGRCEGRAFYAPPLHHDFFARVHFVGRLQNLRGRGAAVHSPGNSQGGVTDSNGCFGERLGTRRGD